MSQLQVRTPGGGLLFRHHNPVLVAQRCVEHLRGGTGRLFLSRHRHPALVVRVVNGRPSFEEAGPPDAWMNQIRRLITTYWEDHPL